MESAGSANGSNSAIAHGRPCVGCRKRRVRCDRTRPCSNCSRSKQLCTYEGIDPGTGSSSSSAAAGTDKYEGGNLSPDATIRDRVARLEALMAMMMARDDVVANGKAPEAAARDESPTGTYRLKRASTTSFPTRLPELQLQSMSTNKISETKIYPVGQILFQDGYSAYFDAEFWPGVINEVEDLRRLLSPASEASEEPSWPTFSSTASTLLPVDMSSLHPSIEESNIICQLFLENVNPFLRILHEAAFGKALDQYRRGTFILPREFEALLFSIYLLTINSLRPEVVESIFPMSKEVLVFRFQQATQTALSDVQFFKSDKIWTLLALIHYLTFLFQRNLHQDAVALLGIAVRLAQNMGHHRDPSHFPYSPWICEIRRRMWNQICCLDALAIHSYGAESCLPITADARPPTNANDEDWHASRFAKPSSAPQNAPGFRDTTFALVHRELADLTRRLASLDCHNIKDKEELIQNTEVRVNEKYLRSLNRSNPSQSVVAAMAEIKLSRLRLAVRHQQVRLTKPESKSGKYAVFLAALELLEAIEYHSTTFPMNWDWIFLNEVPWLAIAIILTNLPHANRQADIDRAQRHMEIIFQRYEDPDRSLSGSRLWKLLLELRQRCQVPWGQDADTASRSGQTTPNGQPASSEVPLAFTDDLMIGFHGSAVQNQSFTYDDPLDLQDLPNMPWLDTQMPF